MRSALSTSRFLWRLLQAMGLSAVALPLSACGNVIVEGDSGAGGQAGSTGAGGTDEECSLDVGEGENLTKVCFASCPADADTGAALAAEVEYDGCDEWCCSSVSLTGFCGPTMENGQCCFDVTTYFEEICMGRPFFIEGSARVAEPTLRADWMESASPSAEPDEETRRALSETWKNDGLFEHASIASFSRFTLELLAVGAPPALVSDALAAANDEVEHARLCFGLASAYSGKPVGPGALVVSGAEPRCTLADIAAAAAEEGCIGETLSAMCAREALSGATDPAVRSALARIAEDEEAHAALAWRFVAWALSQGDQATNERVTQVFARTGPAVHQDGDDPVVCGATFRAHGRLTAKEQADVFRHGYENVVLPCALALLKARAANRRDGGRDVMSR